MLEFSTIKQFYFKVDIEVIAYFLTISCKNTILFFSLVPTEKRSIEFVFIVGESGILGYNSTSGRFQLSLNPALILSYYLNWFAVYSRLKQYLTL